MGNNLVFKETDNPCLYPQFSLGVYCTCDTPLYVREGLEGRKKEATSLEIKQMNLP